MVFELGTAVLRFIARAIFVCVFLVGLLVTGCVVVVVCC